MREEDMTGGKVKEGRNDEWKVGMKEGINE